MRGGHNITYSTGGGISGEAETAPPPPALEGHLTELSNLNAELGRIAQNVHNLADHLFGPQPENLRKEDAKEPVDPPVLRKLSRALEVSYALTEEINRQLQRLTRL